jgi:hypothetical protein
MQPDVLVTQPEDGLRAGQGACTKAPQAILARHDGRARAHAARLLADSAPHESDADVVAAEAERLTRSLRRILLQITLVKVHCPIPLGASSCILKPTEQCTLNFNHVTPQSI